MKDNKVLIIKTGYSEVLINENGSREVSYGDIVRTTPILHAFKNQNVTWVTDEKARPLLEGINYIDRLLNFDWITAYQLESEEFDTIINLEKAPGLCALIDKIHARRSRYGFGFNRQEGTAKAYNLADEVLTVSADISVKRSNIKTTQEHLFEMIGKKWKGEEYLLGYKPKTRENYNVGFNTRVGPGWPTKVWSKKNWDELEQILLKEKITVSRQDKQNKKILLNLYDYIDWLNTNEIIVSHDSLGMHLGIALKKNVLGLFGATPHKEVHFYNKGKSILPNPIPDCMPCMRKYCEKEKNCIERISPKKVFNTIKKYL